MENDLEIYEGPSHDDTVLCCPDCELPNQFGEVCLYCKRGRDADEAVDLTGEYEDQSPMIEDAELHMERRGMA